MQGKKRLKALALSLILAGGIMLPTTTKAQIDGFFKNENEDYTNRDVTPSGEMTTQNFGDYAPVGNGLLIMFAAGAGYVFLKKKED